jgi:site-specific recombinase XerD
MTTKTNDHHLGPFVRRFLLEELLAERNLSPNTQKSYRDTIRLLFGFVAERASTDPTRLTVEQLDAALVRSFLVYLENERGNSIATRNQRLGALHSLFRFIARLVPELVEHAAQIQAIPLRRFAAPVMPYLDKNEIDASLRSLTAAAPKGAATMPCSCSSTTPGPGCRRSLTCEWGTSNSAKLPWSGSTERATSGARAPCGARPQRS